MLSVRIFVTAMLLTFLSGCAVTTTNADGSREVFGLVRMRMSPALPPESLAGETVEVSTIGLLILSNPEGTGIALGYSSEKVTALRNNMLLVGDARELDEAQVLHGKNPRSKLDEKLSGGKSK